MRFPAHSSAHSIWRSCQRGCSALTHGEYFLSEVQTWSLCERLRWRYRSCHFILHTINLLNPWRHSHRCDNIKASELLNCLLLLTWSNDVYSNKGRITVTDEREGMWKARFLAHLPGSTDIKQQKTPVLHCYCKARSWFIHRDGTRDHGNMMQECQTLDSNWLSIYIELRRNGEITLSGRVW